MSAILLNPRTTEQFYGAQPAKFGAFASPEMQVCFWYLEAGQSLVMQKNNKSEQVYVALSGSGSLTYYEDLSEIEGGYVPDALTKVIPPAEARIPPDAVLRSLPMESGAAVAVAQATYHSITADNSTRMVVLAIAAPEATSGTFLPR